MYDIMDISSNLVERNKSKHDALYKGDKKVLVIPAWPGEFGYDQSTLLEDKESEYRECVDKYNRSCRAIQAGFDNVPVLGLDFGGIPWLMSHAYGCKLIKIDGRINSEPLFFNAEDAMNLELKEQIYNYGLYPEITKRIIAFQNRWEGIPLSISDNQSPIDVVTCILHSEEAMVAMFTEKEAVHHLMDIVTTSIIEVNRHFESITKNFAGFGTSIYIPHGMHVSDDDAAFLSPQTYNEFALPYTEKLSEEFGGIHFHCCMGYSQNLENMANTKGFMGFDATTDFNPSDKIINAISNKGVWTLCNYPWTVRDDRKISDEDMFKSAIDSSDGKCGMVIEAYGETEKQALKIADRIKEYAAKKGRV